MMIGMVLVMDVYAFVSDFISEKEIEEKSAIDKSVTYVYEE